MRDDRVEELAKAIEVAAYPYMFVAAGSDEEWQIARADRENWRVRERWVVQARAVCEYFFGKDENGEVVVPKKWAAAKATGSLLVVQEILANTNWEGMARENPEAVEDMIAGALAYTREALSALRGEPHEST